MAKMEERKGAAVKLQLGKTENGGTIIIIIPLGTNAIIEQGFRFDVRVTVHP